MDEDRILDMVMILLNQNPLLVVGP